jgi:uncharacterized protein YecA (UPF0149 family)
MANVVRRGSMSNARRAVDITPVRLEDRWLDDGADLELWTDDDQAGLRLRVTAAGELIVSRLHGEASGHAASGHARITLDPSSQDLIVDDPQEVLDQSVDLGWLRRRFDQELRAAISERIHRAGRDRHHDWKEGDRPRVSVGARARFCDVFPSSWDVLVTLEGRRYALIDHYLVDENVDRAPISIEVIDVARGELVGTADVACIPSHESDQRLWRANTAFVDRVLVQLRQDADEWFRLLARPEEIARVVRRLRTWDDDRIDPDAVVRAALAEADVPDADTTDRVTALGDRSVPALRRALEAEDPVERCRAASLLAALDDASGVHVLAAALVQDDEHLDGFAIFDDLMLLGRRALEPLLEVLQRTRPERRFPVMEALVALGARDERIRDILIRALETDVTVAALLADYGDDGPLVVAALERALVRRLDQIEGDPDDLDSHDDAIELANALRSLDALAPELAARVKDERRPSRFTGGPVREPVRAVVRPGRNEPCWCGSNKKYKKCHLDSDEMEQLGKS